LRSDKLNDIAAHGTNARAACLGCAPVRGQPWWFNSSPAAFHFNDLSHFPLRCGAVSAKSIKVLGLGLLIVIGFYPGIFFIRYVFGGQKFFCHHGDTPTVY